MNPNLKQMRKDKRMTQTEVAEKCGLKRLRYWTYEAGTRTPRPEIAKRIADVLEFDWTKFYEDENKS